MPGLGAAADEAAPCSSTFNEQVTSLPKKRSRLHILNDVTLFAFKVLLPRRLQRQSGILLGGHCENWATCLAV